MPPARGRMSRLWLAAIVRLPAFRPSPRRRIPSLSGAGWPHRARRGSSRLRCTRPFPTEGDTFVSCRSSAGVRANRRTESILDRASPGTTCISTRRGRPLVSLSYDDRTLTLVASVSTRINSGMLLLWRTSLSRRAHPPPRSSSVAAQLFYRFFGWVRSPGGCREQLHASPRTPRARRELGPQLELVTLFDRDLVQDLGVPGCRSAAKNFPPRRGWRLHPARQTIDAASTP